MRVPFALAGLTLASTSVYANDWSDVLSIDYLKDYDFYDSWAYYWLTSNRHHTREITAAHK